MALTRRQLANSNCEVTDSDYEAIASAIMESSRGRWFLSEYARRNRDADTNLILSAIDTLKEKIEANRGASPPYLVSTELSLTHLAKQIEKPPTPLRHLRAVRDDAETRRNDKKDDSDLGRPGWLSLDETDEFKFKK
jgi:hypothetical protein